MAAEIKVFAEKQSTLFHGLELLSLQLPQVHFTVLIF